jgi:hypothetical protein
LLMVIPQRLHFSAYDFPFAAMVFLLFEAAFIQNGG